MTMKRFWKTAWQKNGVLPRENFFRQRAKLQYYLQHRYLWLPFNCCTLRFGCPNCDRNIRIDDRTARLSVIYIYTHTHTYRERCKTEPAHNRCWNWSPSTSKHTWMRFSKFWNTFPKVSTLTAGISWRTASLSCSIVRGVFLYTFPFNRPKERSRQPLDRLPLVSNFLTKFWMQHFDGARLSTNSVRNAVWHALNEPVFQYLRTRNPRCSTVYIDNSLGPLATHPVYYLQWCLAL